MIRSIGGLQSPHSRTNFAGDLSSSSGDIRELTVRPPCARTTHGQTCANALDQSVVLTLTESHLLHRAPHRCEARESNPLLGSRDHGGRRPRFLDAGFEHLYDPSMRPEIRSADG